MKEIAAMQLGVQEFLINLCRDFFFHDSSINEVAENFNGFFLRI